MGNSCRPAEGACVCTKVFRWPITAATNVSTLEEGPSSWERVIHEVCGTDDATEPRTVHGIWKDLPLADCFIEEGDVQEGERSCGAQQDTAEE